MQNHATITSMTRDELIAQIDARSPTTDAGLQFFYDELHRRAMEASSQRMERLTVVITALTTVSVVLSGIALVAALR